MTIYLWVALGSALGGMARFWMSGLVAERVGEIFPWGTMTVNVLGSFIIGLFGTLTAADGRFFVSPEVRVLVLVGFCGGFTTFSSFSLQTMALAQDGEWLWAGANIVLSVLVCLVAVWLGHGAAMAINR